MGPTNHAVALTADQVRELNQRLSKLRHDINNHLSLIVAAVEMLPHKPDMATQLAPTLLSQPQKIADKIQAFSEFFEQTLGISRDQ